jgi:hypothetical protein
MEVADLHTARPSRKSARAILAVLVHGLETGGTKSSRHNNVLAISATERMKPLRDLYAKAFNTEGTEKVFETEERFGNQRPRKRDRLRLAVDKPLPANWKTGNWKFENGKSKRENGNSKIEARSAPFLPYNRVKQDADPRFRSPHDFAVGSAALCFAQPAT